MSSMGHEGTVTGYRLCVHVCSSNACDLRIDFVTASNFMNCLFKKMCICSFFFPVSGTEMVCVCILDFTVSLCLVLMILVCFGIIRDGFHIFALY